MYSGSDDERLLPVKLCGPVPHRVYQRDHDSLANIPFEVTAAPGSSGVVVARIEPEDGSWERCQEVTMVDDKYSGAFGEIPVGRYRMELRVESGTDVYTTLIAPVFVGDLWILAGQSNMVGAGKLIDVEKSQEGISCFYMGDRWDIATEPLCWLNESLDPVNWEVPSERLEETIRAKRRDRVQGAGLGLMFAKEVMLHTGVPIGLIICAHGGTSMTDWSSKRAEEGGNSHYGAMMRKIRKLGGTVKGCLWYQGEADAVLGPDHYTLYRQRMLEWIADLRRDVGDPQLTFIYAQLSAYYTLHPDATGWNRVQQEQLSLEGMLEHVAMVPTINATLADMIHLDTPSLRETGKRMAWQALRLAYGIGVPLSGPRPARFEWNEERTELIVVLSGVNGSLHKVERAFSFYVECQGVGQPLTAIVAEDECGVILRFERPVPPDSLLWHGKGYYPTINVADEMGIPLVVFGPVEV